MTATTDEPHSNAISLGQYLASIRKDRGMSLRQVEETSKKEVSNAYLSQIENEKIKKPSPNILHALSEIYGVKFDYLMQLAGFIVSNSAKRADQRHGRVATFAEHNLTADEESELMEYLQFIRARNKKRDKT